MNILVSPLRDGSFYFRSDSTLIRALTDFYIPDYVESISAVPVLCFRSERSGKAVPVRFAHRYIGPFSCGLLLKAAIREDMVSRPDRIFVQNALDYSTVIPYELLPLDKLDGYISPSRPFLIKVNGLERIRIEHTPDMQEISRRFGAISCYASVRTGDMLAFELAEPAAVDQGEHLTARFGTGGDISIVIR